MAGNLTNEISNSSLVNGKEGSVPQEVGENSGYIAYSSVIDERTPIVELKSIQGKIETFSKMKTNSTISGILLAFVSICQTSKLIVNENPNDPNRKRAKDRARFLETCLDDMQIPFSDVRGEILDMIPMGFRVMVPNFKARTGRDSDPSFNSKHNDGKIGWKTFTPIDPSTISDWDTPEGKGFTGLKGIRQRLSLNGNESYIPRTRMLNFRTVAHNNSPIGKSILEGAFIDWKDLIDASRIQMTGLRRSLEGIPYARIHTKLANDASTNKAAASAITSVRKALKSLDSKEDHAFILPADRDEKGHLLIEVGLIGSSEGGGNTRIQDAKTVIDAKEQTIARSMLAQFMTIQGKGGSYALSKTQSEVFINSLKMYMSQIEGVMNNEAIPQLFYINSEGLTKEDGYLPTIAFSDFIKDDVAEFFTALQKSIEAGVFEVTPQIQKKAGQILGIDTSGQEKSLKDRKKKREAFEKEAKALDEASLNVTEGGGESIPDGKDIPTTKASDIKDEGLNDILNS
jgi:hypothetical protein